MSKKTLEAKLSIWTKIFNFFKMKTEIAIIDNTSTEDLYKAEAMKVINKIEEFRKLTVTADSEIKRLTNLADEKDQARAAKDKEILKLRKESPDKDLSAHVKLALIHKHLSEKYREDVQSLGETQLEIAKSVVELSEYKDDLAVNLELARETANAKEAGILDIDNIIKTTEFTKIDIETMRNKIQVFKGDQTATIINSVEIDDYLKQLEGK